MAVAAAAALQMWHATKVADSRVGRKSRYNDLTINRCQPPVRGPKSNRSTRGKHRQADSRLSRAADAVARACGQQEQSQYQYQYQYHSWPSACLSCSWPKAASCCHTVITISQALPLSFGKCGPVGCSVALLLSSESPWSSLSSCKLSPAIRTEHTALLALTLNCQHQQVADHATRGAYKKFADYFKWDNLLFYIYIYIIFYIYILNTFPEILYVLNTRL